MKLIFLQQIKVEDLYSTSHFEKDIWLKLSTQAFFDKGKSAEPFQAGFHDCQSALSWQASKLKKCFLLFSAWGLVKLPCWLYS